MKTFAIIVSCFAIVLFGHSATTPIKDLQIQNSLNMGGHPITNVTDVVGPDGVSILGGGPDSGITQAQADARYDAISTALAREANFETFTNLLGGSAFKGTNTFDLAGTGIATTNNYPWLNIATSNQIVQMSAPAGGNEYDDMRAATNPFPNHVLGLSQGGEAWLWSAKNPGLGSNVWGQAINFPGGIGAIGNPYWQDLPAAAYESQGVYFGFGPNKSSLLSAWPSGTNGNAFQPYFQVVNANPYGGGASVNVRSGFTNAAHGVFAGNDSNGVPIYVSQYGFQILELSDAYGARSNGILTQLGRECQQAPGHVLLNSDYTIPFYISMNGQRSGDVFDGQIPLFCITTTNGTDGEMYAGFPLQKPNAWVPGSANWRWALVVGEKSGIVATTNGSLWTSNILAKATNAAAYIFGDDFGHEALFNVNGDASFNLPLGTYANYGAWTFDVGNSSRLGFVMTSGDYPHLGHASGSPFIISQYGQGDLHNVTSAHPDKTNELTINPDSTITFGKGMTDLTVTNLGDGANTNLVMVDKNGKLYILTIGSGLNYNATTKTLSAPTGGAGTVTSVGLTAPSEFTVSGSPVTGSGTLVFSRTAGASANFVGQSNTNISNLAVTNSEIIGGPFIDATNVLQVNTLGGARKFLLNTNGDLFANGNAYFNGGLNAFGVPVLTGISNLDATKLIGTIPHISLPTFSVTNNWLGTFTTAGLNVSAGVTNQSVAAGSMVKVDSHQKEVAASPGVDFIAPTAILTNSVYDTNIVVSTNNWSWPGPTNNADYARGTLQRWHPIDTTPVNITNVANFPTGQAGSIVLWIENTNTSALSVKLPPTCEATNSLGGLTVSINASNRLQVLISVVPAMAGAPGSTNALFSDQQLIK